MVDTKSLEIKKIEFDPKAESDGYGGAMTQSSFEDKRIGTKINLEKNIFALQKNMEKRIDDGTIFDGISGTIMTS
ncbi:MAG: Na+-transporting NADH:ubiquinone oxidoreductase subunit C [Maribacter sp.]